MKFTHRIVRNQLKMFVNGEPLEDVFHASSDILDACSAVLHKWTVMSVLDGVRDGGRTSCAFCRIFNWTWMDEENVCRGCPVFEVTGLPGCEGTPYQEIEYEADHTRQNHSDMFDFLVEVIDEYRSNHEIHAQDKKRH